MLSIVTCHTESDHEVHAYPNINIVPHEDKAYMVLRRPIPATGRWDTAHERVGRRTAAVKANRPCRQAVLECTYLDCVCACRLVAYVDWESASRPSVGTGTATRRGKDHEAVHE